MTATVGWKRSSAVFFGNATGRDSQTGISVLRILPAYARNLKTKVICKQSSKISQNSPASIPLLAVPGGSIRHKVYQSCVVSL